MSEQLPKFEDLRARDVNDMIGEYIMGWEFAHDWNQDLGALNGPRIKDPSLYWITKHAIGGKNGCDWLREGRHSFELLRRDDFNPYESLDDCHLAEEKLAMATGFQYRSDSERGRYEDILRYIVDPEIHEGCEEECDPYLLIHATAKQKCHAMLKAKGLVR